jgi:hypothetical protein
VCVNEARLGTYDELVRCVTKAKILKPTRHAAVDLLALLLTREAEKEKEAETEATAASEASATGKSVEEVALENALGGQEGEEAVAAAAASAASVAAAAEDAVWRIESLTPSELASALQRASGSILFIFQEIKLCNERRYLCVCC